jgi:hypothetical protein
VHHDPQTGLLVRPAESGPNRRLTLDDLVRVGEPQFQEIMQWVAERRAERAAAQSEREAKFEEIRSQVSKEVEERHAAMRRAIEARPWEFA